MEILVLLLIFILPVGLSIWFSVKERTSRPTHRDSEHLNDYYIPDPEKFWKDMMK